jgi:hypothetical protein
MGQNPRCSSFRRWDQPTTIKTSAALSVSFEQEHIRQEKD